MTKRQAQILRLWFKGKFPKEIASELHLSQKTVGFHFANIYRRAGGTHPVRILKWAISEGVIPA